MKMRYLEGRQPGYLAEPLPRGPEMAAAWPFSEPLEGAEPESKIEWGAYWASIKKRGFRVLLAAALIALLAGLYAQSIQPVFRSTTTLLIESGKTKILSIEEVYNAVSQDREYYQTQVEILRSRDVALRTVIAMKLWEEPEFDPRKPVRSLQGPDQGLLEPTPATSRVESGIAG